MQEQKGTFLVCQMCTNKDCQFRSCSDSIRGSIFCRSLSQSQRPEIFTTSQGSFSSSTSMSNNFTSEELYAANSTTASFDKDQLPSTSNTLQMSSNSVLP